ncbi:MAG: hypothetical protein V1494_04375 [Candidatus Diapherotrites archaeon]
MKWLFLALLLILLLQNVSAAGTATIFKNESCGHCEMYLNELKTFLSEKGFSIEEKNFINDLDARAEWVKLNRENNIPIELQGHLLTVVNGRLFLEGHVPLSLVQQAFEKYPSGSFPEMVIYQDEMLDESDVTSYKMLFNGSVSDCVIEKTVSECASLPSNPVESSLPLLVLFSGLLAGIHPCTIGVLLFFIAFLFTIRRNRIETIKIGGSYIIGVFLAYFLIGLGLLTAITFPEPHFAAKIASLLIIALGLFNIARFFFPQIKGIGMPSQSKKKIIGLVERASVPAALLLGIFVGICSFGCTAGIYFSVVGFLLTAPAQGIAYLFLYNLMFVLPLIAILIFASNQAVIEKIGLIERKESKNLTLAAGIVMVAFGVFLWLLTAGHYL